MAEMLLEVRDLITAFHTDEGSLRAVDGVSFELPEGGTLGVVGESGCGKSVTSLSVMRLIPEPPGAIEGGQILFEGKNLLELSEREMRGLRGNHISMIFQEPMTSLNPVYTVGKQIVEAVRLHQGLDKEKARARAIEMLDLVGIPAPAERVDAYPHELSGGMRQRVMIAMALSCEPKLLIADEPTTALDVTIQAQILDLLKRLQRELGMSIILITHDLGVVAEFVDEIVVMYAGKVVERASARDLFVDPKHPYTRGLLSSLPSFGDNLRQDRLPTIKGVVPDLRELPEGCRFRDRCGDAIERCKREEPPLLPLGPKASEQEPGDAETPYRDAGIGKRLVACFVAADLAPHAAPARDEDEDDERDVDDAHDDEGARVEDEGEEAEGGEGDAPVEAEDDHPEDDEDDEDDEESDEGEEDDAEGEPDADDEDDEEDDEDDEDDEDEEDEEDDDEGSA